MDEFADFIMSRVKEVVSGSTFNEHVRTDPSSRYLQDKERGAVRRNILMIERYYKVSLKCCSAQITQAHYIIAVFDLTYILRQRHGDT